MITLICRFLLLYNARKCICLLDHGIPARYVKLRVVHAPGMPGTFSPPSLASDPYMHHGTCVTHVTWCTSGSQTSGFLWSQWRGKRSRHSRRMRNPQFYAYGKRPMWSVCDPVKIPCWLHLLFPRLLHCTVFGPSFRMLDWNNCHGFPLHQITSSANNLLMCVEFWSHLSLWFPLPRITIKLYSGLLLLFIQKFCMDYTALLSLLDRLIQAHVIHIRYIHMYVMHVRSDVLSKCYWFISIRYG